MKKFKANTIKKQRVKTLNKRRSTFQQGHPIVALHMDQYLNETSTSSGYDFSSSSSAYH
jgi:hypothetical protein